MTKVKICGLKTEQDIAFANALQPDYIGFVFLKGRQRYVSFKEAAQLRALLSPSIPVVGVFVDEPVENVISLLQEGAIQIVQLHGTEDIFYVKTLKDAFNAPIIRAFQICSEKDVQDAFAFPADFPLLDNGKGTGETFDWSLMADLQKPFFLAGGLHADNVKEAITKFHPYAVDVSSGVETAGSKDFQKMKAFIDAVRR